MEAFEERNKNSKIIRNILSGALTDPDEIRMRYRQTPVNARELLAECEDSFGYRYPELIFYSFTGNFKSVNRKVRFDGLDCDEIKRSTLACENRRVRARILLSEISPLIGFGVATMTGVALFAHKIVPISIYISLLIFLFLCLVFLFILLAHYRIQVHAWTAFKEEVILRKSSAE